jgi:hypothetical protein
VGRVYGLGGDGAMGGDLGMGMLGQMVDTIEVLSLPYSTEE